MRLMAAIPKTPRLALRRRVEKIGEIGGVIGNINQELVGFGADVTNGTTHIAVIKGERRWRVK